MLEKPMILNNADDLLLSSYQFELPSELIAQRPKVDSRLLIYNCQTNEVKHDFFKNIADYLPSGSQLVFNRSKVFPSRLIGKKESGGKAELFLLSLVKNEGLYPALIKTRSKKKRGDCFLFPHELSAKIEKILEDGTFEVSFNTEQLENYLDEYAKIPIPPYIRKGESDDLDKINYQTVYAKERGSVAAPTAGLHFKEGLLEKLKTREIDTAYVTLHVGLGTFKPVSTDHLLDHKMHAENYFVDPLNQQKIKEARRLKKKIFAVGTTALRVLESSFEKEIVPDTIYSTNIFIYPGIDIKSVDGLITNFHLPQSTLLMLVSGLVGREKALELYQLAIKERYRFFSYGDGMLIIR